MHSVMQPIIGPLNLPAFLGVLLMVGFFAKFIQTVWEKGKNEQMRVGKVLATFVPEHGHEYECPCVVDGIRLIPPVGKEYQKLAGVKRNETLPNVYFLGPRRANDEEFEEIEQKRAELRANLASAHNPVDNAQIALWRRELDYLYQKEFMMIEKPPITLVDYPRNKKGFFGRMTVVQMAHITFREISADPINPYGQVQLVDPIVLKAQLSEGIAELVVKTIGDYLEVFQDLQKSLDKLRSTNPTIMYLMLGGAILLEVILLIIVAPKMGTIIDKLNQLLLTQGIPIK